MTSAVPRVHASTPVARRGTSIYDAGRRLLGRTLVAARASRRPGQPKAATTNRVRDYRALEREFITGDMSLRELCRAHGVTAHSAVRSDSLMINAGAR